MIIPTVVGIIGPSVASLRLVFKGLLSSKPWLHDTEVLPIPYRSEAEYRSEESPNLSFEVFLADGVVTPHPPITRAVRMVAEALEDQGYKVILFRLGSCPPLSLIHYPDCPMGAAIPCGIGNNPWKSREAQDYSVTISLS